MFKATFPSRLLVAALLLISVVFSGCQSTIELTGTEIREYQGEDLSSIQDFRENSIKGPQYVDIDSYRLIVDGLVSEEQEFSYDEVIGGFQSYEKVITLYCVEGWQAKILWQGVLVKDLLAAAGVLPEAQTVIFYAYDGYTTSLPLDYIMNNEIVLAYKMNGLTLPPERGYPFELAAESKWGYKWIKWVVRIELSDDIDYEGYWESRGYSNNADLDKPFFD